MKLALLGPVGSYTDDAASDLFADATVVHCSTIDEVFAAVASGGAERGLVPVENVIAGPVTETLDNLFQRAGTVHIIDMILRPITHALGVRPGTGAFQRVLSKDQALQQCARYLASLDPQPERVATASTSSAAQIVAQSVTEPLAAIASPRALARHGLSIVARDIGNVANNKTRFALLAPTTVPCAAKTGRDVTALVVCPTRDRIGLLHQMLGVLSQAHGINCLAVHSRPDTHGGFRFYFELEGHVADPPMRQAIADLTVALSDTQTTIHILGGYPKRAFAACQIQTIGIIGGTGRMGGWLQRFFSACGFTVCVSGPGADLSDEACVQRADVVLLSVPIDSTVPVIERLGPSLRQGQLMVDNTSVKSQPVAAMQRAVSAGAEVLGMHTIFGPHTDSVRGQNVIFTRTDRSGALASEFEDIFHKHGAHVTITTPQHHDRQMAFHQNLEHFTKVVLAEVLRAEFPEATDLDAYASPNSRASLATMERILNADPELVSAIQRHNSEGPRLIRTYLEATQRLGAALASGDTKPFAAAMRRGAEAIECTSSTPPEKTSC